MTALRILHIDDEPDIREVVAISLSLDPELEVRGCASGSAGIADAMEYRPDLILLDVMMPVMDGPTTLAHLRDNPKTANIPVVFMTARAQTRELDLFMSLGAVGVIAKPFDPMTLAASVRTHVQPVEDDLAPVRGVFLRRLSDDAFEIAHCRNSLGNAVTAPAALTRISEIAHGLAGAGGIFGFPEISSTATILEEAVVIRLSGADSPEVVERAVDRLLACIETNSFCRKEPARRHLDA
jgi:two-component system OmpR family response regulator